MICRFLILFIFFIFSCSFPIKINKTVDKYPDKDDRIYHSKLIIYSSIKEIEYDYIIIATIQLKNNAIYGNLNYDYRMQEHLLNRINGIGGDALIYNENLSDSIYSFFNVTHFTYNNSDALIVD